MCIVWLEDQPVVEIDGKGVKITYTSGDDVYVRRATRAWYRRYLETSIRALNDFEAAARERVVELRHG